MVKLIIRLPIMLISYLSASLQIALMGIYGEFDDEGNYLPNRPIPELMVRLLQFLGKSAKTEV